MPWSNISAEDREYNWYEDGCKYVQRAPYTRLPTVRKRTKVGRALFNAASEFCCRHADISRIAGLTRSQPPQETHVQPEM